MTKFQWYLYQTHDVVTATILTNYKSDEEPFRSNQLSFTDIKKPLEMIAGIGIDRDDIVPHGGFLTCSYRFKRGVRKGELRYPGIFYVPPHLAETNFVQLWKGVYLVWCYFGELELIAIPKESPL